MADLTDIQSSQSVKIAGANPATGIEDNYMEVDSAGRTTHKNDDGSGNIIGPAQIQSGVNYLPVYLPLDLSTSGLNITTQDIGSTTTSGFANQVFILGTPTANSFATIAVGSIQTVMTEITGLWTGTLSIEVSSDGGTLWVPRGVHLVGTPNFVSSVTANMIGSLNASAKTNVRVRATTAMTGTAIVRFVQSDNPSNVYVANAVKVIDGASPISMNQMAIKAASTAALPTDTSVVVALNPGTALNLPTGAATSALQTTGNASLASIDTDIDVALSTRSSAVNQTNGTQKAQTVDGSGNIQPSGDVLTRAIFVKTTDGTNNVTVKAASTAAQATDTALVVAISPNNIISTNLALTASAPTVATVGVASASAVASNANRRGLILMNNSINTIYLGLGATAVIGSGITLYPGGTFQMDSSCLSTAAVNAIASAASSSMAIQEFTL